MPGPNLELARRAYSAFAAKDHDAVLALAHPEVEYEFADSVADDNICRGPEEVRQLWRQLEEIFAHWESRPEEFIELEDRVLVLARESGVGRASGLRFDQKLAHLLTFEDGLIIRFQVFNGWKSALRTVGLGADSAESEA
jgi:ketosteroid isomerase-like protein